MMSTSTSDEARRRVSGVSSEALDALQAFSWPGNVRQLRNAVRRALVVASGPLLTLHDLPDEVRSTREGRTTTGSGAFFDMRAAHQNRFEKEYLVGKLRECGGDVSEAARRAEVPRGTFYRLMKKHDFGAEPFRSST